ncbi:unnamed protein product [Cunninghamella blakesleeana]
MKVVKKNFFINEPGMDLPLAKLIYVKLIFNAYDNNNNNKSTRDTDTWSVAATVDDQESVISTNTQKSRLIHDVEEDEDDNMILDGITSPSPLLNKNTINNNNNNNNSINNNSNNSNHHSNNHSNIRFEIEEDIEALDIDTIASQGDDEKYARSITSRSVAAEYGDRTTDGFGSELSLTHDDVDDDIIDDVDDDNGSSNSSIRNNNMNENRHRHHSNTINGHHGNSMNNNTNEDDSMNGNDNNTRRHHRHHHHHHSNTVAVDDCIRAPTEPQPSIATVDKSYSHLLEENELLQSQLRQMEITTKQQQEIIATLQSHHQPYHQLSSSSSSSLTNHDELNSAILSQRLTKWAELVAGFAKTWTKTSLQQRQVEEDLFHHVLEYYLHSLPFGTENQVLLNTAYQDQLTRFHSTLGASFAKWYRRQTVQSLARNPATQDYLHAARMLITQHICRILDANPAELTESSEWQSLLDHCARLSLELHGGEYDVMIRPFPPHTIYNEDIMTVVDDDNNNNNNNKDNENKEEDASTPSNDNERHIKLMLCPLFIDEQDNVLLPARVILE